MGDGGAAPLAGAGMVPLVERLAIAVAPAVSLPLGERLGVESVERGEFGADVPQVRVVVAEYLQGAAIQLDNPPHEAARLAQRVREQVARRFRRSVADHQAAAARSVAERPPFEPSVPYQAVEERLDLGGRPAPAGAEIARCRAKHRPVAGLDPCPSAGMIELQDGQVQQGVGFAEDFFVRCGVAQPEQQVQDVHRRLSGDPGTRLARGDGPEESRRGGALREGFAARRGPSSLRPSLERTMPHRPFALALIAVLALPASGAATPLDDTFTPARGWFWYRELPPEPEPEPAAELPVEPPAPPLAELPPPAPVVAPVPATMVPFSAAWVRDQLPELRDRAIEDPTPENVRAYMLLQRVALDMASEFERVTAQVVQGDPLLDETFQRPLGPFATQVVNVQAAAFKNELLRRLADAVGLLFFFEGERPTSARQAPLVRHLQDRHELQVLALSLDGAPLPGNEFPDYQVDRTGLALQLGVERTPALFLLIPDGVPGSPGIVDPIGQGMFTAPELEQRIVLAAARQGLLDQDDLIRIGGQEPPVHVGNLLRAAGDGLVPADPADLIPFLTGVRR
ncbi:MAG: hypothetical protein EA356_07125 [Geminicoccaceae bacterium]|nr:MAG: hypothetical protein EA356_12480 [Geminicoccaceae bacterium]TVQ35657.1 MAG: hypothetical protein EA356_07125 [Geminicoccaceae bacterium]